MIPSKEEKEEDFAAPREIEIPSNVQEEEQQKQPNTNTADEIEIQIDIEISSSCEITILADSCPEYKMEENPAMIPLPPADENELAQLSKTDNQSASMIAVEAAPE